MQPAVGQRLAGRRGLSRGMVLAVVLSLLVHAVALLVVLWRPAMRVPVVPENQATVQVIVGTGHQTGASVPPPAPPPRKPEPEVRREEVVPPPVPAPPVPKPEAPKPEAEPPPPRPPAPKTDVPVPVPPPPPTPQPSETVAPAPVQPPAPVAKAEATPAGPPPVQAPRTEVTPAPEPKVTTAPMTRPNLPLEFGDLGGPLASIDPNQDKSLQAATRPDQGNLPPAYPPEAERRREEGTVALALHIGADGFVDRVDMVQSSGYPLLDQAAVSRLRTWHFTPAVQGGVPVASIYRIAVTFGP